MNNQPVVGLTLFSVLQKPSKKYVIHENGYESYVKDLFSESRLNLKSDIFFNISLPQMELMDKSGCEYHHFLIYSEELPEKYKEKIYKADKEYDFLLPVEVSDYSKFDLKKALMNLVPAGSEFALFGLDDDDLLSFDYLQKLRRYIKREFVGFNIVMSKGFTGFYDGGLSNCREVRFPFINIGQARICSVSADGKVFVPPKGSHMRTDEVCPTVLDSRNVTFFWFRHLVQDTFSKTELKRARLKINNDLDSYLSPSEAVTNKFPVLKRFLNEREFVRIFSKKDVFLERRKQRKIIYLDKNNDLLNGEVIVNYNLVNVSGGMKKQAILIFNLSGFLDKDEVFEAGLYLSKVGYYRYFNTEGDSLSGSFTVNLPKHVSLVSLEAMKWGEESVLLEAVDILKPEEF